ncbi:MAG: permease, partial [Anaerolineae bacterium]|nr:permease [Anaerolineae bacterium]
KVTPALFLKETFRAGRRLLIVFVVFAFVGYFLNGLIPAHWIPTLFGGGKVYSVPLAATLALPFYINTEASLPLVRALLDSGMSEGAALAFLISGAGTSFGAMAGALTVARWRVVGLVLATLWVGAILSGLAYDMLVAASLA